MLALKIVGGMLFFVPIFIFIGVMVGKLAEKNHTVLAFLLLFAGLAALIALTLAYGHAVR
jgi:hypothetical protein